MNLVTGATGTIGAQITYRLLQQNKTVVCTKRKGSDINKTKKLFSYYSSDFEELFNRIKWIDADICDIYSILDALDGIQYVYHCAGFVSFDIKNQKKIFQINVEGTANIVNACLEKKVNLCHVSSIAAIQNTDIAKNIHEGVYWKSSPNIGNYAISKYNGEREVWRGMEEGLNAVIVNPGIVLSPGFWNQSSGKLFNFCYKGSLFYTNGVSASIDVTDVANCMIELMDKKLYHNRYILIENNYYFKDILSKIHISYGNKAPRFLATKALLMLATIAESIRSGFNKLEPIFTKETVKASLDINTYSNSKIKMSIGYSFKPIDESIKFITGCYKKDLAERTNSI
ncbi:MAG: SDR family NAD(P)-dependent oxidoreductase [Bacteroidota bacterium]